MGVIGALMQFSVGDRAETNLNQEQKGKAWAGPAE
jgi:hypothetical protein